MEINLLQRYPKRIRDTDSRAKNKTQEIIDTNLKFDWEYFDKKGYCYNGYSYDGRWIPIVYDIINFYGLKKGDKVLDVGCAKGYTVYDFVNQGIEAYGIDISSYAIGCSPTEIRNRLYLGNAKDLSRFKDNEFDLVISINCIHCLNEVDCRSALREIERVGKHKFVTVDAYRTEEEKKKLMDWVVAARTVMSRDDWIKLFREENYNGNYYWFYV